MQVGVLLGTTLFIFIKIHSKKMFIYKYTTNVVYTLNSNYITATMTNFCRILYFIRSTILNICDQPQFTMMDEINFHDCINSFVRGVWGVRVG